MSDLSELRRLILGNEIVEIEKLQYEITQLVKGTNDREEIIARITPVIDTIVQRSMEQDRAKLVRVLAPMIADIIELEIKRSGDKIAVALAPVIGRAMQVQMREQKDEIVDALYPVIGSTVARYVSQAFKELLETIGEKLESTFSYANVRRKLVAKLKGVPESELLLRENIGWKVDSVFLIHKVSGLLMAERLREGSNLEESEMVASMLTAIRSFVNDWIAQQGENAEINEIEYGDSTIYLEVAGYCYIAVVLKGSPTQKLTDAVNKTLASIVYDYADEIKQYQGDPGTLPLDTLHERLQKIIDTVPEKKAAKERKTGLVVGALVFSLLAALSAGWFGYRWWQKHEDQQQQAALAAKVRHDPQLALYRIQPTYTQGRIVLKGAVPNRALAVHAEKLLHKMLPQAQMQNRLTIGQPYLAVDPADVSNLKERFTHLPQAINYLFFEVASSRLGLKERAKVAQLETLMRQYPDSQLEIRGYSDNTGSPKERLDIAQQRAHALKSALLKLGIQEKRLHAAGTLDVPPGFEAGVDTEAQKRCVSATLKPQEGNP